MKKSFWLLVCICLFTGFFSLLAQNNIDINGKVVDAESKSGLISATVLISSTKDDAKYHDLTSKNGNFEIKNVKPGSYKIRVTYVGYETLEQEIRIGRKKDLGEFALKPMSVETGEVEVTAKAPLGQQNADTSEFNSNAFKTAPDATTEDLIKKMPGVQVESDGTVKAQGEQVKKVLVDGKPFFGDDPTVTLRNLPAEVVDKIQIYDKMSDQAEFTGFDDGNSSKTLNIITKQTKRQGQFGRLSVGYGEKGKYNASGTYNYFGDGRRISIIGMSNNVNQQNFNIQDIIGSFGGGRGPGGAQFARIAGRMMSAGFGPRPQDMRNMEGGGGPMANYFIGQMNGLSTTNAIGLNYSDLWTDDIEVNASYFFNITNNDNNQSVIRDYILENLSGQRYNQSSLSSSDNTNHRFNMQFKWDIDSSNAISIRPAFTAQVYNNSYKLFGINQLDSTLLNTSDSKNSSDYNAFTFQNELNFRHKFNTPGRTLSFELTNSANDKSGSNYINSFQKYYTSQQIPNDSSNQKSNSPVNGWGMSGNVSYTEPLSDNSQFLINYSASFNTNMSDKRTYDYDYALNVYDMLDTLLSNKYDNDYLTQRAGIGYKLKGDDYNFTANVNYQKADLKGNQDFPYSNDMKYSFDNILPSLMLNYKFSKTTNLRINYRSSTNSPSITQLQNVVDNSTPTQLSAGNPNLKQQYTHNLNARYSSMNQDFSKTVMMFASLSLRNNYIANSTFVAPKDTVIDNFLLAQNGTFTRPVNLDGYMQMMSFFTYGFQVPYIKSNLNLNLGGSYTRTPGMVNNVKNNSDNYNVNFGFVLASNIDENLDFSVSTRVNLNRTKNSRNSSQDNDYNDYINTVNLQWTIWEGIFLQADLRNQIYTGLTQGADDRYTLLNFSLGKKFLPGNAAEIKLSAFDVLDQNKNISTNVTDYYIEYSNSNVLTKYIMLTFSYNLRSFGMSK